MSSFRRGQEQPPQRRIQLVRSVGKEASVPQFPTKAKTSAKRQVKKGSKQLAISHKPNVAKDFLPLEGGPLLKIPVKEPVKDMTLFLKCSLYCFTGVLVVLCFECRASVVDRLPQTFTVSLQIPCMLNVYMRGKEGIGFDNLPFSKSQKRQATREKTKQQKVKKLSA